MNGSNCQVSYIPRGVHGENLHQNHPYYYYTSMPTHPNQRMPPHPNHNMPLHFYSKITPHQVCLCPYCTSNPIYAPYLVAHYPRIPSLCYLHHPSPSILPFYMPKNLLSTDSCPCSSMSMIKHRRVMRDKSSNLIQSRRRDARISG